MADVFGVFGSHKLSYPEFYKNVEDIVTRFSLRRYQLDLAFRDLENKGFPKYILVTSRTSRQIKPFKIYMQVLERIMKMQDHYSKKGEIYISDDAEIYYHGLTKREHFAAKTLVDLIKGRNSQENKTEPIIYKPSGIKQQLSRILKF